MSTSSPLSSATRAAAVTQPNYPVVAALTAVRKSRAMTQAQLATEAGLSRMTVQRLESNGLDPRLSTLQEMARVLEQELVIIPSHLSTRFHQWLKQQATPKDGVTDSTHAA